MIEKTGSRQSLSSSSVKSADSSLWRLQWYNTGSKIKNIQALYAISRLYEDEAKMLLNESCSAPFSHEKKNHCDLFFRSDGINETICMSIRLPMTVIYNGRV
jgi:hypothetical protein